ncbi:phosphonatase-like hydrolase [Cryobacterium roopkundense]|uniref:Phosphonatase-like hydrolase n=1 Tax=Cryobacterium roopkundense TaxID=1001240 RepID=A0A7W8ZZR1_9MICO|nr:phosphonatase-like hydrolase [Cryobacterium roopkundense]MBB5642947.1 phosphonatase-like hydrolase [Cryobacterium roopkundense]
MISISETVTTEYETDDLDPLDVELVVFDMAGTTVQDEGLVERAFALAVRTVGIADTDEALAEALDYVRETMGRSKMEVFRALATDEDAAQHANAVFESTYLELLQEGGVRGIEGAEDLFRDLRKVGVKIALITGFSRATQQAIIEELGWKDHIDLALSPTDAGRGRPYPDLPLMALLRTGATNVAAMVVVGDTASDMISGVNAGAGLVVGVLSGAHDADTLEEAGADAVIESIADLAELLGLNDDTF